MEGANILDCLLQRGLLFRGRVEGLADELLAPRLDFEKDTSTR